MGNNFIDLSGSTYLITGASSGIGRAISKMCYQLGANLILLGRDSNKLAETTQNMDSAKYRTVTCDLMELDKIESMVKNELLKFGKINGFCHSAGYEITLPLKAMKAEAYIDILTVNSIAGFELAKVLSKKKYCNEDGASFVYISSITGIVSRPGLTAYSASKGAVISAVKSMALELAPKRIRVNSISPGTVLTPLIKDFINRLEPDKRIQRLSEYPLGLGNPEDIANMVVFLLSERSKWITGTNIVIDGGYTAK